jgi:hypothetical protein
VLSPVTSAVSSPNETGSAPGRRSTTCSPGVVSACQPEQRDADCQHVEADHQDERKHDARQQPRFSGHVVEPEPAG